MLQSLKMALGYGQKLWEKLVRVLVWSGLSQTQFCVAEILFLLFSPFVTPLRVLNPKAGFTDLKDIYNMGKISLLDKSGIVYNLSYCLMFICFKSLAFLHFSIFT